MKVLVAALAMIATNTTSTLAQASASAGPAAAWSGCYALSFRGSSAPVLFADSGTLVRLDTTVVGDGYLVRPGPGRSDRRWRRLLGHTISWRPIGADSLRIFAPYGYWWDVLDFRQRADSLVGIYRVNTDVIDSAQVHQRGVPVYGKRVACRRSHSAP